jgi:hypothetical protein
LCLCFAQQTADEQRAQDNSSQVLSRWTHV